MVLAHRLIIVLLALLLMFAVACVILFAWAAAPESVERLSDFVQFLDDHAEDDGSRVILTLGGAVVALLALVVVIAELTPPQTERVPVRDVKAGDALLSTDAIAQRLQQERARPPRLNLRYSELRLAGATAKTSPFAPPPPQEAAEAGMAEAAVEE